MYTSQGIKVLHKDFRQELWCLQLRFKQELNNIVKKSDFYHKD